MSPVCAAKWFDLYPEGKVTMPPVLADNRADTPRFSWYLHWKVPEPRLKTLQHFHEWQPLVPHYLASVSCMDAQVGRVLSALDASGRSKKTIVVLWSDHGWHLGEKQITGKNTLWNRSTHVPLVFAGPHIAQESRCMQPVELLDIYPTLLELPAYPPARTSKGTASCRNWATTTRPPVARHHHAQSGQSQRPHQSLAVYPLRRRLRRTVRRTSGSARMDQSGQQAWP